MNTPHRRSQPHQQHYLPASFLNGFARNGDLLIFDLVAGRSFPNTPAKFGRQADFYTFTNKEGQSDFSVETEVFGTIDGKGAAVLAAIEQSGRLPTGVDWEALAYYVAALSVRVPHFRQGAHETMLHLVDLQLHSRFGSREAFEADKAHFEEAMGAKLDMTYEEIRRMIDEDEIGVSVHRNNYIRLMLDMIPRIAEFALKMTPRLLVAIGRARFVTADVPVAKFNRDASSGRLYGTGWSTKSVEVYVPLNSQKCLVLDWGNAPVGVLAAKDMLVGCCNSLIIDGVARHLVTDGTDVAWVGQDKRLNWGLGESKLVDLRVQRQNRPAVEIRGGPIRRRASEPFQR